MATISSDSPRLRLPDTAPTVACFTVRPHESRSRAPWGGELCSSSGENRVDRPDVRVRVRVRQISRGAIMLKRGGKAAVLELRAAWASER